jgi:hypothetical protein
MRSTLLPLSAVALAACSHSSVDKGFNNFTGTVTGVIALPDATACDDASTQLSVYATTTDDKGQTQRVGRASVHRATGHCSYTVAELPPSVPITIHVDAVSGMKCGNGATAAFASQAQQGFSLTADQFVTRDFQPQCSATTSSL